MELIEIENMEFWAYHGCFKEEQVVGNRFLVNLWLKTDGSKAAKTDNLADALDYQLAYEIVKSEMAKNSKLLENVCERILDSLYQSFEGRLSWAKVKVSKMNPPMGGQIEKVSVTLEK